MPLVSGVCPNCHGSIKFNTQNKTGYCHHCGQEFIMEDAITVNHIKIDNSQTYNIANQHVEHQTVVMENENSFDKRLHRLEVYVEDANYQKAKEEADQLKDLRPDNAKVWLLYIKAFSGGYNLNIYQENNRYWSEKLNIEDLGTLAEPSVILSNDNTIADFMQRPYTLAKKYAKDPEELSMLKESEDYLRLLYGLRLMNKNITKYCEAINNTKQEYINRVGKAQYYRDEQLRNISREQNQKKADRRGVRILAIVMSIVSAVFFLFAGIAGYYAFNPNEELDVMLEENFSSYEELEMLFYVLLAIACFALIFDIIAIIAFARKVKKKEFNKLRHEVSSNCDSVEQNAKQEFEKKTDAINKTYIEFFDKHNCINYPKLLLAAQAEENNN